MAKFFLITYDLKKPGQNYTELYEEIKGCGEWQHPLESVWVVKVEDYMNANNLYLRIRPKIDDSDFLLIVDITSQDRNGWLLRNFWEWLKQ